jgi:hypothetical protein
MKEGHLPDFGEKYLQIIIKIWQTNCTIMFTRENLMFTRENELH